MPGPASLSLDVISLASRRQRLFGLSFTLLLGGQIAGCAHSRAETSDTAKAPDAAEDPLEARIRQDNASLRKRLLALESRVRLLERQAEPTSEPVAYARDRYTIEAPASAEERWSAMDAQRVAQAGPRNLPVVKLERETLGERREGRVTSAPRSGSDGNSLRMRESVTLTRPAVAGQAPGFGVDPEAGAPYGVGWDAEPAAPPTPAAGNLPSDWEITSAGSDDGSDEVTDDDAPRRKITLIGSRLVEATKTKRKPPKKAKKSRTASSRGSSGPEKAYQSARKLYTSGDVTAAEQAFDAFAKKYPSHDHADNALYWKGEAAYDQRHYSDALAAFTAVVERYGGGNKAPDALLKIGLCYGKVGDHANAKDVLEQLVLAYPNARASSIAKKKLQEISGEHP